MRRLQVSTEFAASGRTNWREFRRKLSPSLVGTIELSTLISVPEMQKMAKHGGYRPRRYVTPGDAAVWCPDGRWGPRRTRVSECWSLVRAEDVYTGLLKDNAERVAPGALGTATFTVRGHSHSVEWEVRQNTVWRRGRVFLRCPRCTRRCTRLYLPLETSWLACRRCWGLSYVSRQLLNYKDSLWGRGWAARMFKTTQREWALDHSRERREGRLAASRERWRERARLLPGATRRRANGRKNAKSLPQ
jgi:hypothetical protein